MALSAWTLLFFALLASHSTSFFSWLFSPLRTSDSFLAVEASYSLRPSSFSKRRDFSSKTSRSLSLPVSLSLNFSFSYSLYLNWASSSETFVSSLRTSSLAEPSEHSASVFSFSIFSFSISTVRTFLYLSVFTIAQSSSLSFLSFSREIWAASSCFFASYLSFSPFLDYSWVNRSSALAF